MTDAPAARSPLLFYAVVAALAGFLFGFDTAVISGAEKSIQDLWGLSKTVQGLAISSALWGTVLGSILGGWPTDTFGRRKTLIAVGVLYFVSAVWSALSGSVGPFAFARFLGGVGVGVATVAAPMFISEIAPPDRRGRLTGMFQFNIVFGILVALFSNWAIGAALLPQPVEGEPTPTDDLAWRWMLGVEAFPALVYVLMALRLPESPRWLLSRRKDRDAAAAELARIEPSLSAADVETRLAAMEAAEADALSEADLRPGVSRLKTPLLLAFLIAMFNQLSGINAILYFAPRIFEQAGFAAEAGLLKSVGLGVTNLIFTFVGIYLIDRLGRRTLLLIGSVGYVASLGLCSWAFANESFDIVPACLFAFMAAHAVGQGAVIWVFISEIFPQAARGLGQSVGSATHWVFAAALTSLFPLVAGRKVDDPAATAEQIAESAGLAEPQTIFAFFCGMMALQLVWVLAMVPETKGVPLEEIERRWRVDAA